jgi:hypothetical protein
MLKMHDCTSSQILQSFPKIFVEIVYSKTVERELYVIFTMTNSLL